MRILRMPFQIVGVHDLGHDAGGDVARLCAEHGCVRVAKGSEGTHEGECQSKEQEGGRLEGHRNSLMLWITPRVIGAVVMGWPDSSTFQIS